MRTISPGTTSRSNRSQWLKFLTLKHARWSHENIVMLGDAAHTAHFSIGSGTKLALEDAIALARAFEQQTDIPTALRLYALGHKPRVEAIQRAAAESQRYFENVARYGHFAPLQFAFNLLTRAAGSPTTASGSATRRSSAMSSDGSRRTPG